MKIFIYSLILSFAMMPLLSCGQNPNERMIMGEQNARQAIKKAIEDKEYKPFYDTLIKDKVTAIAVVEPILFKIYGKKNIVNERPYECYFIDGHWYISGTLPKGWHGGVFEIIISAKDGGVIKLIHGQ